MTRLTALLLLLPLAAAQTWWHPAPRSTWDIQLSSPNATIARNPASILDLDLLDNTASTIAAIHAAGKHAICYFSAGTYEDWRPDVAALVPGEDYASPLGEWPGEYWLVTTSERVRDVMRRRLDIAAEKGCDAVDPDNVDGFDNDNGWGMTEGHAVEYVRWLAGEAHKRGLAVGLKNALSIASEVVGDVDFQVNEQCVEYQECAELEVFVQSGKAVFGIEYPEDPEELGLEERLEICSGGREGKTEGHSTLLKRYELDNWVWACPV